MMFSPGGLDGRQFLGDDAVLVAERRGIGNFAPRRSCGVEQGEDTFLFRTKAP